MQKHSLISPALMWALALLGAAAFLNFFDSTRVIPENPATPWLIVPAALYWLFFLIGAVMVNSQAPLSAARVNRVIREGVYRYVRHPIYSADIMLAVGLFFLFPFVRVLMAALWAIIVFIVWARLEERALTERFGGEYSAYKTDVPMFIPRFRRF